MTNAEVIELCGVLGVAAKGPSSSLAEAYSDMVTRRAERDGLIRDEQPEEPAAVKKAPAKKKTAAASTEAKPKAAKKAVAKPAAAKPKAADASESEVVAAADDQAINEVAPVVLEPVAEPVAEHEQPVLGIIKNARADVDDCVLEGVLT